MMGLSRRKFIVKLTPEKKVSRVGNTDGAVLFQARLIVADLISKATS